MIKIDDIQKDNMKTGKVSIYPSVIYHLSSFIYIYISISEIIKLKLKYDHLISKP